MNFNVMVTQFVKELDRQLTKDEYRLIRLAYDLGKQHEWESTLNLLRELKDIKNIKVQMNQ